MENSVDRASPFRSTFAKSIAIPSLSVLILLPLFCVLFPGEATAVLGSIQSWFYKNMSWAYVFLVTFFVVFLVIVAIGKTGTIRLGADNSEPQFSFFSWIAMLFAAGLGIGLMYFGVAEPMAHYVNPAISAAVNPAKEAQLQTFFHWGIHAWAVYASLGLILAYFSFRYKLPLSIRSGLFPILKQRIHGPIGAAADVFALCCTFFGIITSLGFGVMQLCAGLNYLHIIQRADFPVQMAIIAAVTGLALISCLSGVNKGVKILSETNLVLAALLMLFCLALGPSLHIINAFSEGLGYYIGKLPELTFNTFAFEPSGRGWFTDWTIMYWAWWISWAPFVGMFIARISRGRTIREFICGVLLIPSLFIFLWMTVFGNGAIWLDQHTLGGALSALAGSPDILLFKFFEQFPGSTILCAIALIVICIFFVTSADSGILVINSIACANRPNSPKWQYLFWGGLIIAITGILMNSGGLKALQTMTLITALPFGCLMVMLCLCLWHAVQLDLKFQNTKLPYGSFAWDGSKWRDHLDQIVTFANKKDIRDFMKLTVLPAFEQLRDALAEKNISAEISTDKDRGASIELIIRHDKIHNFVYGVTMEERFLSEYIVDDDNTPQTEDARFFVPITYYVDGRRGNDIEYLDTLEIIADVLREYERFIAITGNKESELLSIDKSALAAQKIPGLEPLQQVANAHPAEAQASPECAPANTSSVSSATPPPENHQKA